MKKELTFFAPSPLAGSYLDNAFGMIMYWLLPFPLFFAISFHFFAFINAIPSRTRELRADWIAATTTGKDAFVSSLQKVVQYSAHFGEHQEELSFQEPTGPFQQHRALASRDAAQLDAYRHQDKDFPGFYLVGRESSRENLGKSFS